MNKYNFKSHDEVPDNLADYVVDVCVFSGLEINSLTDIKLSDINAQPKMFHRSFLDKIKFVVWNQIQKLSIQ